MLTTTQLHEIKLLQLTCEEADAIKLKLNWDMLETRKEEEKTDFLYYENDQLAGFLGLYGFGNKIELCGMVHPSFRRKGIFSRLFENARSELVKYEEVLLNAPADSSSAKGFLSTLPQSYKLTEYQMKWHESAFQTTDGVSLRLSTEDDVDLEVTLDVECFGFTEEEAKNSRQSIKNEGTDQFLIVESEEKAVGKLRVGHPEGEAWIYGFAILPEYQGKGIGRKVLSLVVEQENKLGFPIFLEVEAKNAHALKLYESCGFRIFQAQDYYELKK